MRSKLTPAAAEGPAVDAVAQGAALVRHPARGYALALAAATMWALNASLARYLLEDGVSATRLSQLRSGGSCLILLLALALIRRDLIRVERGQVPALAFLGIARACAGSRHLLPGDRAAASGSP